MNYCRWVLDREPTCVLPDDQRPLLEVPAADPGSDWICVRTSSHPCGPDVAEFVDAKYRVSVVLGASLRVHSAALYVTRRDT